MGIKLAKSSSNNNSALEEFFFFCTQVVGTKFDPFAIC
jgi:hypothetical protein